MLSILLSMDLLQCTTMGLLLASSMICSLRGSICCQLKLYFMDLLFACFQDASVSCICCLHAYSIPIHLHWGIRTFQWCFIVHWSYFAIIAILLLLSQLYIQLIVHIHQLFLLLLVCYYCLDCTLNNAWRFLLLLLVLLLLSA